MTDEDAFLTTICDRLDDQLPRLVFADWLDEHGRGDEAAAWRATADKWPVSNTHVTDWTWWAHWPRLAHCEISDRKVFESLAGGSKLPGYEDQWRDDYPTARAALLDLVAAWVKVEEERPKVCRRCEGRKGRMNPTGGYREFSGSYPVWEFCPECGGTNGGDAASATAHIGGA